MPRSIADPTVVSEVVGPRTGVVLDLPLQPFSISVDPARDEVIVVPAGELDLATAERLEAEVGELRDAGFEAIVVDLRQLTFIESTGLRVLLTLRNTARRADHRLVLVRGPRQVQRVFEMTATQGLFDWRDR